MEILGVDIDNTLTNAPSAWNKNSIDVRDENIAMYLLNVNKRDGVEILSTINMKIVLITARHEDYRNETINWLENNLINYDKLIMRTYRFSNMKFDLNEYLQHKYNACLEHNIKYMIDDDEVVVNNLNKNGITSVLVDKKGRFDTAYYELLSKIKENK